MKYSFDSRRNLIYVEVQVHGPSGMAPALMALDTGATKTCISPDLLLTAGIDPNSVCDFRDLATANGYVRVGTISALAVRSLGQTRTDFPIICHTLPSQTGIDGVLGLDFIQSFNLAIDFRAGTLELS